MQSFPKGNEEGNEEGKEEAKEISFDNYRSWTRYFYDSLLETRKSSQRIPPIRFKAQLVEALARNPGERKHFIEYLDYIFQSLQWSDIQMVAEKPEGGAYVLTQGNWAAMKNRAFPQGEELKSVLRTPLQASVAEAREHLKLLKAQMVHKKASARPAGSTRLAPLEKAASPGISAAGSPPALGAPESRLFKLKEEQAAQNLAPITEKPRKPGSKKGGDHTPA